MATTLIEASVAGAIGRAGRAALIMAIEAEDPQAEVEIDAAGGRLQAETELDIAALLEVIESAGCHPVLQPQGAVACGERRDVL